MATPKVKVSEANVQRAIQELLAAKKIRFHRLNAGSRLVESKGKRYCIRMQEKGCADLLALVQCKVPASLASEVWIQYPHPLYIEVKCPGKKQRPEQIEFQREVTDYGCSYLLADSVDTVIEWLAAESCKSR